MSWEYDLDEDVPEEPEEVNDGATLAVVTEMLLVAVGVVAWWGWG